MSKWYLEFAVKGTRCPFDNSTLGVTFPCPLGRPCPGLGAPGCHAVPAPDRQGESGIQELWLEAREHCGNRLCSEDFPESGSCHDWQPTPGHKDVECILSNCPMFKTALSRPAPAYKCEQCHDTGWYGDNGSGIKGNKEYQPCECRGTARPAPAQGDFDPLEGIHEVNKKLREQVMELLPIADAYQHMATRALRAEAAQEAVVEVRKGWENAGRKGRELGRYFVEQWWSVIKWDDEEDPETVKSAALVERREEG